MKNFKTKDGFCMRLSQLKRIMKIKLAILILLITVLNVNATVYSQSTKLNAVMKKATVKDIFKKIESQSEFRFYYNDDLSYINKKMDINVQNETIEAILNEVLTNSDLAYKILEDNLVIIAPNAAIQQGITISGVVTDNVEALPGVNITVKGTTTDRKSTRLNSSH